MTICSKVKSPKVFVMCVDCHRVSFLISHNRSAEISNEIRAELLREWTMSVRMTQLLSCLHSFGPFSSAAHKETRHNDICTLHYCSHTKKLYKTRLRHTKDLNKKKKIS